MDALLLIFGWLWWMVAGVVVVAWRWVWRGAALVAGAVLVDRMEREFESGHNAEVANRERERAEALAGSHTREG